MTPSVLVDETPTLGTLLGIGSNPVGGLGVVFAFLSPSHKHVTRHRRVRIVAASEAKSLTTTTNDFEVLRLIRENHYGFAAVRNTRTPFDAAVVLHVGLDHLC
jgi:hypothetical protein